MEEQITTMWNDSQGNKSTVKLFCNWPCWNNLQASYWGIVEKTGTQLQEAQILGIGPESYSLKVSPVTKAQYVS
jgi:hypothetical protein